MGKIDTDNTYMTAHFGWWLGTDASIKKYKDKDFMVKLGT